MSKVVNMVGGGGGDGSKIALVLGLRSNSLGTTLQLCNTYYGQAWWDKAFSQNQSYMADFTCKKAGTYRYTGYAKGGYTSSGAGFGVQIVIYKNGTAFFDQTSQNAGAGINLDNTVSLAVGDVITVKMRNTTSSTTHSATLIMELQS